MTKILIILVSFFLLAGIAFLFSFKMNRIETPDYKVIKTIGNVEIRHYPKMIVAKTALANASYKENSNQGFRTIAGYIFGGNEKEEKIAMTAPVVMQMGDSATMYFVMPRKYGMGQLPKPKDQKVQIVEETEKTLAVIRFGGYSNDQKIKTHCEELSAVLKKNGISTKGGFIYMGYNAPWDFINRRNEVAIEVLVNK
jgi:hypothetical protein